MNIQLLTIVCSDCNKTHEINIDIDTLTEAQIKGTEQFSAKFTCPEIAVMYKVIGVVFDFTVNNLKDNSPQHVRDSIANQLKEEWGGLDFEDKLQRFIKLNHAFYGTPDEYYQLLRPIVSSYCCGNFYPSITSAGALGERILNRLVLKTRDYFKSSQYYDLSIQKSSNWPTLIKALIEWKVISEDIGDAFTKLKKYRNDSIHYNAGYDFEGNSYEAIKLLLEIVDKQFNYLNRKDLFWAFDCPGEVLVRTSALSDPFVKEFVLPYCRLITPFCEPMATPPIRGKNTPLKPLSDEDFIKIRSSK
ncbi:hypothetical protein CJD36_009205 [Flavipsychrobacter stenotrophus]|uniref:DUF4145 domain-containing protein n=1 Tax=Flavipsychrobacter stenotrophus TaxID=2077091 RepID=A0A2S7SYF7_9BACT|nr:hypothetical protein [Flavipsychrobacter stenotrophus]PQJ11959.1 hypothetical protein CJD36_009205 [Flavipsychrobacter stenotrophus]